MKEGARYRVAKHIRDMCVFSTHDLVKDPPFSKLDLASCGSLLIYFEVPLRQRVTLNQSCRANLQRGCDASDDVHCGIADTALDVAHVGASPSGMQDQLLLRPLGLPPLASHISSEDGLGVHPRDKAASEGSDPPDIRVIFLAAVP